MSAGVLAVVAIAATWWGGLPFALFWAFAAGAIVFEWLGLFGPEDGEAAAPAAGFTRASARGLAAVATAALPVLVSTGSPVGTALAAAAVAVAAALAWAWTVTNPPAFGKRAGWVLPGIACGALVGLTPVLARGVPDIGAVLIAWMFAVTWTTDIAAYFSGRAIGGPKLWPRVSPKKTWAGFAGGTLAGTFMGWLVGYVAGAAGVTVPWGDAAIVAVSALASLAGQGGDLAESALKRHVGVKDTGALIPGHGGVMDRLDGFAAVCLLVAAAFAAGALLQG